MDSLICELARHLRVADADVKSVKLHDEGYEVLLVDGCHMLVAPHGDYLLNHDKTVRRIPHWDDHKHKFVGEHRPEIITPKEATEVIKPKLATGGVLKAGDVVVGEPVKLESPPDGTSDVMLKWVGDRVDRAEAVLKQERERTKPRLALIKQLERIVDG